MTMNYTFKDNSINFTKPPKEGLLVHCLHVETHGVHFVHVTVAGKWINPITPFINGLN